MKAKEIVDLVKESLLPFLNENNYELVDAEFVKEGPTQYLRIYIDKDGGVTINDCEIVTRHLNKILDKLDPIPDPYILEVSSPGLDRPLKTEKDYEKYKGRQVELKLYKNRDGVKNFEGELLGLTDDVVTIICESERLSFTLKEIASCKLAVIF